MGVSGCCRERMYGDWCFGNLTVRNDANGNQYCTAHAPSNLKGASSGNFKELLIKKILEIADINNGNVRIESIIFPEHILIDLSSYANIKSIVFSNFECEGSIEIRSGIMDRLQFSDFGICERLRINNTEAKEIIIHDGRIKKDLKLYSLINTVKISVDQLTIDKEAHFSIQGDNLKGNKGMSELSMQNIVSSGLVSLTNIFVSEKINFGRSEISELLINKSIFKLLNIDSCMFDKKFEIDLCKTLGSENEKGAITLSNCDFKNKFNIKESDMNLLVIRDSAIDESAIGKFISNKILGSLILSRNNLLGYLKIYSMSTDKVIVEDTDIKNIEFIDCNWIMRDGRRIFGNEFLEKKQHAVTGKIYRQMKQSALEEHNWVDVSEWHYSEKEMERFAVDELKWTNRGAFWKCFGLSIYKISSGYNEKPFQGIGVLVSMIILSGLLRYENNFFKSMMDSMEFLPFIKTKDGFASGLSDMARAGIIGMQTLITVQIALVIMSVRNKLRR